MESTSIAIRLRLDVPSSIATVGSELALRGVAFTRQAPIQVAYKGRIVGDARIDLLVGDRLIVELKAVEQIAPIHLAQTLSYLKTKKLPLALLVKFNAPVLRRGVRRVLLSAH